MVSCSVNVRKLPSMYLITFLFGDEFGCRCERLVLLTRMKSFRSTAWLALFLGFCKFWMLVSCDDALPLVINTWPFVDANEGGGCQNPGCRWVGTVVVSASGRRPVAY